MGQRLNVKVGDISMLAIKGDATQLFPIFCSPLDYASLGRCNDALTGNLQCYSLERADNG
jgi:hypothetical protein